MTVAGYQPGIPSSVAYSARARLGVYTNYPGNAWNTVLSIVTPFAGFTMIDFSIMGQVPTGHRSSARLLINGADPGDTRVRNEFAFSGPVSFATAYYATLASGDIVDLQIEQENAAGSINVFTGACLRLVGFR